MAIEDAKQLRTPEEVVKRIKTISVDGVSSGIDNQPVSGLVWVPRENVRPNPWNSNFVPKPELRLLKISILAIGWVFPIVVSELTKEEKGDHEYEINDGHHRWLVSHDPEISALTDGRVPAVVLHGLTVEQRKMVTVRMNRARGNEHVLGLANLVGSLVDGGVDQEDLEKLLQMESEEISRFLDRGNMLDRGVGETEDFGNAWVPK